MVERSGLVPGGVRTLVALSGGPDSTALLLALVELGRDVVAAHFDHALREESARDAEHVAALCESLGVRLVSARRTAPLVRGSVQAAARTARYAFLEEARAASGAGLVAIAHTRDDNLETLLINLLRGTDVRGLRGIPASRPPFVRPLLSATRAEVAAHLAGAGVAALEDPSNRDLRFLRVRVRRLLLPALVASQPALAERLATLADAARAAEERLDAEPPNPNREALSGLPRPARAHALARLFKSAAPSRPGLRRRHLEALDRLVAEWSTGASLDLPGAVRFRVLPDRVTFDAKEDPASGFQSPVSHTLVQRHCEGCQDASAVHLRPGVYRLGRRAPGLRMRPAGAPGSRKLQDILTDARVPRHQRDAIPVVFRNDEVAWLPGIAWDPNHTTDRSRPGVHVEVLAGSPRAPSELTGASDKQGGAQSDRW